MEAEAAAIRLVFGEKRALMLRRLYEMGIGVDSTSYVFANLRDLPPPLAKPGNSSAAREPLQSGEEVPTQGQKESESSLGTADHASVCR